MAKHSRVGLYASLLLVAGGRCLGAEYTWTGATDGSWNTGTNWAGGVPASAADTVVVFGSTTQPDTTNNVPGGLVLNALEFLSSAGSRSISGNPLIFDGAAPTIVNSATAGHVTISAPISLLQTVTVSGGPSFSAQLIFDGAFSGTGGLNFGGITTIAGTSSYTGATVVQGALGVQGSSALGLTSGVVVAPGGELQLIRDDVDTPTVINRTLTLGGLLSSQAQMAESFGAPIPGAAYTGAITLSNNATVHTFGAMGFEFEAAEFVISGPINRAGHSLTLSTAGSNNTTTVSGAIGGNGNLLLTPQGGSVAVGAISGDGDVTFSGGGGIVSIGSLAGNGDLLIQPNTPYASVSVSGAVSGNRDIIISAGSLTLSGTASTFTGSISLSGQSTLFIADESRLGNAANTITMSDGASLNLTSLGDFSRAISITSGGASINTNGNSRTISSNISGAGSFGVANFALQAIVTLSGSNSFAGGLFIGSGVVLAYSQDSNLGAVGGRVVLDGGNLLLPGSIPTFTRDIEVDGANGGIAGVTGGAYSLAGSISGTGRLDLSGAATYQITGTNTAAGGLSIVGDVGAPAILELGSDSQLGGPNGVLNIGRQNGFNVLPGMLRATGDLTVASTRSTSFRSMTVDTNGHTVTFNQSIAGRGMTKTGDGTWILNAANSDSSDVNTVVVEQGTLRLGVNDALGSRASIQSLGDEASLDLAGFNLELASVNSTSATSTIQLGSGTLTLRGGSSVSSSITGSGGVVLGKAGFSGGTTFFSGSNSFSGGITVREGSSLYIQNIHALGASGNALILDNGTLAVTSALDGPLVINNSTNLTIGSGGASFQADGQSIIIDSALGGTNPIRFLGGSSPGTDPKYDVRLMNTGNTFVGDVQLGNARNSSSPVIIGIAGNGSLGDAANTVTLGNSYYDGESTRVASGGLRAYADIVLPGSRTIQLDGSDSQPESSGGIIDTNGHTVTIAAAISQLTSGMQLLKVGAGTLLLNGENTYTGRTLVEEGALGGNGSVQSILVGFSGTLAPGSSAGLLTVNDELAFSGGALAIELGGTARGLEYDALDVGGSVSLGGAMLEISFLDGFESTILSTDVFTLLDAGAIFDSFGNVLSGDRLTTADGFGSFLVTYNGETLVLTDYAAVPEPGTLALAAAGALLLAGRRLATPRARAR